MVSNGSSCHKRRIPGIHFPWRINPEKHENSKKIKTWANDGDADGRSKTTFKNDGKKKEGKLYIYGNYGKCEALLSKAIYYKLIRKKNEKPKSQNKAAFKFR